MVQRPAAAAVLAAAVVFLVSETIPGTRSVVLDLALRAAVHGAVHVAVWVGLPGGRAARVEITEALGALRPRASGVAPG